MKTREMVGSVGGSKVGGTGLVVTALAAWCCATTCSPATAQENLWRVSLDSAGAQVNNVTAPVAVSANGRFVVIWSDATNLVAGDANGHADAFVRDRLAGTTDLVSVNLSGTTGNGDSGLLAAISADGRFVAFHSYASDLVASDTNGKPEVFVRDRLNGTTEFVCVDSAGAQGNGNSYTASMSADGRFLVFESDSDNLVANDTNQTMDVFVRDRLLGTTERVSVDASGTQSDGFSWRPVISGDGRFVAFDSYADDLVSGDTNGSGDVFVHDRQTGAIERVSVDSNGGEGASGGGFGSISGDGRFVSFGSFSPDLVAGDTNGFMDVFVRDRSLGTTERVSVDSTGAQGNGAAAYSAICGDGRFVVFESNSSNLVAGDTNGVGDIYVRDRSTGVTRRVNVGTDGSQADRGSGYPGVSADGRVMAFSSAADNLVTGDTNATVDAFVRGPDLTLEAVPASPPPGSTLTFGAWEGRSLAPNLLVVTDLNGTPMFIPVLFGSFDAAGAWSCATSVPPGLSGNVLTVALFGIVATGKVASSNAVPIAFP